MNGESSVWSLVEEYADADTLKVLLEALAFLIVIGSEAPTTDALPMLPFFTEPIPTFFILLYRESNDQSEDCGSSIFSSAVLDNFIQSKKTASDSIVIKFESNKETIAILIILFMLCFLRLDLG